MFTFVDNEKYYRIVSNIVFKFVNILLDDAAEYSVMGRSFILADIHP